MLLFIVFLLVAVLVIVGVQQKELPKKTRSKAKARPKTTKYQSNDSSFLFPDRVDTMLVHSNAVEKAIANKDYESANLSYAKLVESLRQQNINENGNFESELKAIREQYDGFRKEHNLEYPKQFLPSAQRKKETQPIKQNAIPTLYINNEKLKHLISEIKSQSHPEYPLLRKEYATSSRIPYTDFSGWIIEQLKQKDYNSLFAFVQEAYLNKDDKYGNNSVEFLKDNFEKFLAKDFSVLFNEMNEQIIYEIQAFFILSGGFYERNYWIGDSDSTQLLCKVLSVYSFEINQTTYKVLIQRANKFLREIMKDDLLRGNKREIQLYELKNVPKKIILETQTDLNEKMKQLYVGERIHFFDFASSVDFVGKYWNGGSSYKTRSIGIRENESVRKMLNLGLFMPSNSIESVSEIASKGELKEAAENAGFEIKKSWTKDKIYENLMKLEEGKVFLETYIKEKKILSFNEGYRTDLISVLDNQQKIKSVAELITVL